jgi:hypothetical protein
VISVPVNLRFSRDCFENKPSANSTNTASNLPFGANANEAILPIIFPYSFFYGFSQRKKKVGGGHLVFS